MTKAIWFDMDGTIADLYGVDGWLDDLNNKDARPYREAKPLINLNSLARILNRLQRNGYTVNIVSWLAKNSTSEYDKAVTNAKIEWLNKHLNSVKFDTIAIVPYGTPKQTIGNGILFDDEENNRKNWIGKAYNVDNIIETLKAI